MAEQDRSNIPLPNLDRDGGGIASEDAPVASDPGMTLRSAADLDAVFRIIATSNRNLGEAVCDGAFREDLLFRLNVVNLKIPPLRERPSDPIELAQHFVRNTALAADAVTRALVGRTVADVERDLILETLKHCLGNRTHAANILGISIRTLRNKLNEYAADGIPVPPPNSGEVRGAA
jgi:DNA-binding NtrC family response regulator